MASQQKKASCSVKWALLLGEAGDDALEVYNSFKDKLITKEDVLDAEGVKVAERVIDSSQDYDRVLAEFDKYAEEKKSLTGCREIFNARNQKGK